MKAATAASNTRARVPAAVEPVVVRAGATGLGLAGASVGAPGLGLAEASVGEGDEGSETGLAVVETVPFKPLLQSPLY